MLLLVVSLNGLSRSIETLAPGHAFQYDPLNSDARAALLIAALNESYERSSLEDLLGVTYAGLLFSPLDARFHSLLGELRLRSGDNEEAHRLFLQAHRLSHTEVHALQYLIEHAIETGDYAEAVEYIDVLLRRWPDRADAVFPLLPQLLTHKTAYATIAAAMATDAPWRARLLNGLARQEEGLGFAYQLLLELADTTHPAKQGEISTVIRGFMSAKRYDEAYRLFRFTIPQEERALAGFIYNSAFLPSSLSSLPFSWQYRNSRAAEIRLPAVGTLSGASVNFLSAPAKDIVLHQTLVLAPGRYRLVAEVDASSLRAPRALYWRVRCQDQREELLRLDIPEGSYQGRRLEADFDVTKCALQRIELATDVIAESWQNRYSGQVRFHFVTIERADLAETEG
ncbi:tetratricopeptide repeat protein [Ochrobactrum sp. A-1]|uniref:tetratricopeptide repeat protein n=1 Tax=Ochrobactrum sp. A-1 TaxID=2920940 RepID=UPI001F0A710B|nr:hypothetical protein [Ochrobactrum sp. A-1]